VHFFKEFVSNPGATGAVAPSSHRLAEVIVDNARIPAADRIVELGPGSGAFTERILSVKRRDARFLAVERNPRFAAALQARYPALHVVTGCASQVWQLAGEHGISEAESVVCGLPWANFDRAMQESILGGIGRLLGDGGVFATFAYFGPHWLPAGRRFRALLAAQFREVCISSVVFNNLPPAFVYRCMK
jgi:phosphatidylethanolamine/phosphatidyl-N-methylethanolamine N-methyltransferase